MAGFRRHMLIAGVMALAPSGGPWALAWGPAVACAQLRPTQVPSRVEGRSSARGVERPRADGGGVGGFQRVEPGVGDVDALGMSLRDLATDLRQPLGFSGVYRVPAERSPTGREVYARASGATVAVFPRSEYEDGRRGVRTLVPAGTVFYIGGLPRTLGPRAEPGLGAVDTRVERRVGQGLEFAAARTGTTTALGERAGREGHSVDPAWTGVADQPWDWRKDAVAASWGGERGAQAGREEDWARYGTGLFGDEDLRRDRVAALLRAAAARARSTGWPVGAAAEASAERRGESSTEAGRPVEAPAGGDLGKDQAPNMR